MSLRPDQIKALPKVLLHDHLDGGLRPATIIELAAQIGYQLPSTDPQQLGQWFVQSADSGSLERYLETFAHTCAVMQTAQGLRRVAREAVLDLAADGVVYAEQRYAPEQHLEQGLTLQQVVDAVEQGFAEGIEEAAQAGRTIRIGTLISAMRQADNATELAQLALANRDSGAVGFDIAGPEAGFPPANHAQAFTQLGEQFFPVTMHAGEGDGVESVAQALRHGALRLGHGVRIIEDVQDSGTGELGPVARWVRDRQIPLEVSVSSNLQTGIADTVIEHPVTTLRDLGFAVTINTDNRLMSGTSMTREMTLLAEQAGWELADLEQATLAAARNAFAPYPVMEQIITTQIIPGYEGVIS
ncbi:MAG: adenosine deaminase [Beutenbergiaceae bacterium]